MAALQRADFYLGGDSLWTQLAVAAGVPFSNRDASPVPHVKGTEVRLRSECSDWVCFRYDGTATAGCGTYDTTAAAGTCASGSMLYDPADPPRIATRPKVPLCASVGRAGSVGIVSMLSIEDHIGFHHSGGRVCYIPV